MFSRLTITVRNFHTLAVSKYYIIKPLLWDKLTFCKTAQKITMFLMTIIFIWCGRFRLTCLKQVGQNKNCIGKGHSTFFVVWQSIKIVDIFLYSRATSIYFINISSCCFIFFTRVKNNVGLDSLWIGNVTVWFYLLIDKFGDTEEF